MDEVAEVVRRVAGVTDAAGHRSVESALTQERRAVGRHVGEVIGQHEHLHHRLVGIEQRLSTDTVVNINVHVRSTQPCAVHVYSGTVVTVQ